MELITFGKVRLTGCGFSRPKPLFLLSYLTLEGPQERRKLAELFWRDKSADKKALQKKLGKLSVVLAQFKKEGAAEAFPNKPGLDPIPSQVACDALKFLAALDKGDLAEALELYKGPFLHDLGKPLERLDVSGELEDWVLEKREYFAQKAQLAMLELAERTYGAGHLKESKKWAERAYKLPEAPTTEPAVLSQLTVLLSAAGSDLAENTESDVATSMDELSGAARKVLLALTLQDKVNLTVVRTALELSISELSQAREALILNGLIDADSNVLAKGMARGWLEERPSEHMPLLLALARATPPGGAFKLYRAVYQSTQGFGGVGDLPRARAAYCAEAKKLMDKLKFADVAKLMSDLRSVEIVQETDPDPEARFLEAYALERTGNYKEALELLQPFPSDQHNPNTTALLSVLYWRCGKRDDAQTAAEKAIKSDLDWLWARAVATNTLGYLAFSYEAFEDAASNFKKAASLFQTAGAKDRWVGSLNNYAITLGRIATSASTRGMDKSEVESLFVDAEDAYTKVLELQDQDNLALRARTFLNLGMLWEKRQDWIKAEAYYLRATPLAEEAAVLEITARLKLNLGFAYFKQGRYDEAKITLTSAIEFATIAGEFLIQGMAIANLAILNLDCDAMEIALDLIEQSGNQDQLVIFQAEYEKLLCGDFEEALSSSSTKKVQAILEKLTSLYKKQGFVQRAQSLEEALKSLAQGMDLRQNKAFLMTIVTDADIPKISIVN